MARSSQRRILADLERQLRPFTADGSEEPNAQQRALAEARQRGFEEGVEQVTEQFERHAEELRRNFAESVSRLTAELERQRAELEELIARLVIDGASFLLRARLEQDDPLALRVAQEVVRQLPAPSEFVLRLHPADAERVAGALEPNAGMRIEPDPALERGDCVADSASGSFDATLATAREALLAALRGGEDR